MFDLQSVHGFMKIKEIPTSLSDVIMYDVTSCDVMMTFSHVLHQSSKFLVLPLWEGLFQVLKVSFDQYIQKHSVEKLTLAGQLAPLTVAAYDFGEYLEPIQDHWLLFICNEKKFWGLNFSEVEFFMW